MAITILIGVLSLEQWRICSENCKWVVGWAWLRPLEVRQPAGHIPPLPPPVSTAGLSPAVTLPGAPLGAVSQTVSR